MPTIALTGASGFIGRHLHKRLSACGANVIALSRQHRAGMIQVNDYSNSPDADVLIHLGEEPNRALVNSLGQKYLEESARIIGVLSKRGYRRFIYISSGTVYGDSSLHLRKPGDVVICNDFYNRSKLLNESITLDNGGAVARLSNIYGSGMATCNVMSDIIAQVPGVGPLKVRDESPIRDYLHVSDLVNALERFAVSNYNEIINIGSGFGTSVRRLAEITLAAAGQADREIISTNLIEDSLSVCVLDVSLTNLILNWQPEMIIDDWITEHIQMKAGRNHGQ